MISRHPARPVGFFLFCSLSPFFKGLGFYFSPSVPPTISFLYSIPFTTITLLGTPSSSPPPYVPYHPPLSIFFSCPPLPHNLYPSSLLPSPPPPSLSLSLSLSLLYLKTFLSPHFCLVVFPKKLN